MKALREREIQDLLRAGDQPAPPADLAARIKAEIPDVLPFAGPASDMPDDMPDDTVDDTATVTPMPSRRFHPQRWALAATVVLALGSVWLATRVLEEPSAPNVAPAETSSVAPLPPTPEEGGEALRSESRQQEEQLSQRRRDIEQKADDLLGRDANRNAAVAPAPAPPPPPAPRALPPTQQPSTPSAQQEQVPASSVGRAAPAPRAQAPESARRQPAAKKVPIPDPVPDRETIKVTTEAPMLGESKISASAPVEGRRASTTTDRDTAAGEAAASAAYETLFGHEVGASIAPSTGGTAEPNDAPYGDVFLRGYGVNPFIDTEDDRLSTFGLDVDTASYTLVRRYLRDGHLPSPDAVRVEELINYFDYGDAPPREGDFAIHAEGTPSRFGEGERYQLLRFHLHGREVAAADRPPASLTFVIDVSGSMGQENRLGLVKQSLRLLVDELRDDDRIAVVVYGSNAQVVLTPTSDRAQALRAIEALQTGGSTNAEEGLVQGYALAAQTARRKAINRVILCSDGVANVGRTGPQSILEQIGRYAAQGIELTTVGFGLGNYNDVLMEQLADRGNGRYAYVDTLDEARRLFVENLTGTLQTIAAEARVQVDFNPEVVARYRLLGYENRDIADERFRDDTVDAGEIGAGHTVTALYEIKTHRPLRPRDRVATLHLRYASIAAGEMMEQARAVTGRDFAPRFEAASPALQLTALVAELGEILKGTYWARTGNLHEVFRLAQQVSASFAGNLEVADFVSLTGQAARLQAAQGEQR